MHGAYTVKMAFKVGGENGFRFGFAGGPVGTGLVFDCEYTQHCLPEKGRAGLKSPDLLTTTAPNVDQTSVYGVHPLQHPSCMHVRDGNASLCAAAVHAHPPVHSQPASQAGCSFLGRHPTLHVAFPPSPFISFYCQF